MIQRCENLRLSLKSGEALRVRDEGIREHLQSIVPLEPRMMRSPHLPHAALAEQSGDFVGADAATGADGHVRQSLTRCTAIGICDHIHRHEGESGVRRILGVLALARKHGPAVVEDAATRHFHEKLE